VVPKRELFHSASRQEALTSLVIRLDTRRIEIEQAILARVNAIPTPVEVIDPEYRSGLRNAIAAAIDCSLNAIQLDKDQRSLACAALFAQARLAARNKVDLHTVLRRCFLTYTIFHDFLLDEASRDERLQGTALRTLVRSEASMFDLLFTRVGEEYVSELEENRLPSSAEKTAKLVRRLLAGELPDTSEITYDFECSHIGIVAKGHAAPKAIRHLARVLDTHFLLVNPDHETVWAWLGGDIDKSDLDRRIASGWPSQHPLALGEIERGLAGWRHTHQQARAIIAIASRRRGITSYADVALVASMSQDDLLAASLYALYLAPLTDERDESEALRDTLRAYFSTGRNGASAAATLGVSRQTVSNRLRTVEDLIGRSLTSCAWEMEAALRLADLGFIEPKVNESI
jgi:PucR-like helix-turn-helix protein